MSQITKINLVDASIGDLKLLLDAQALTSVDLVSLYLHRIGKFDYRGPRLNSIILLNPRVFEEAQASDDYRAAGLPPRPLEGIPFTVKDSFRVEGLTVAAASPAFADLKASSDASVVTLLRQTGAILLGKTNMPPMADGGCQRGLYGRSESPYNPKYLSTAYASGSSYGCGVSTAASFAAFGLAGEAVTSGRSPASNNALVAYTSSRGLIPTRGLWPLYPTCDLVAPHTRTMEDLFRVLNAVVGKSDVESADYWRSQPYVNLPTPQQVRPADYLCLADSNALKGKRIAVPKCFIGASNADTKNVCSSGVRALWGRALKDLESLGATVLETNFPLFENYTRQDFPGQSVNVPGVSDDWTARERCDMIALSWDDFLRSNGDEKIPSLVFADINKIHPHIAPMDDPAQHTEAQNQVRYDDMFAVARERTGGLFDIPGCKDALRALEAMRKNDLEDWMDKNQYDVIVFPTNGDVALADSDENYDSMLLALRDGVKYANGGRSLKHLGVPCLTVPMGMLEEERMPVGLSFAGRAYQDNDLLRYAFAYESVSKRRSCPPLTPQLPTDEIIPAAPRPASNRKTIPVLNIKSQASVVEDTPDTIGRKVTITGTLHLSNPSQSHPSSTELSLQVFVNGEESTVLLDGESWSWTAHLTQPRITEKYPTLVPVPRDQFMVYFIAKSENGRSTGSLLMID
ncbi:Glutamyl-tRNA(Gln) amidotransferase subunit A [Paramyrothecium foliicola]|nr:Glutamyl-tRNA(Gln) amidotransferase subunit A [Paramyrothecium foliicola]